MYPLTIFEGPDCGGKSTAAYEFLKRNPGQRFVHHGPYPQLKTMLPRLYVETMLPMLMGMEGQIWDRCWLSEPIYGDAFRNGDDRVGVPNRRHLERFALRHGAVVVLCLPNFATIAEKWEERKGEEYLKQVSQLQVVYDHYVGLRHLTHLPVVLYDYRYHSFDNLVVAIEAARTGVHPNKHVHSGGNWNAPVVLIGDKPSELKDEDCSWRVPFGSFAGGGSSRWLTFELQRNGFREDQLLWANASDDLGWLRLRHNQKIFALGIEAGEAMMAMDLDHVTVPHPQHHKRFKGKDRYNLMDMLDEEIGAGVP